MTVVSPAKKNCPGLWDVSLETSFERSKAVGSIHSMVVPGKSTWMNSEIAEGQSLMNGGVVSTVK